MTFGDFINFKRREQKMSLRKFAGLIGISAAYLSDIENGKRSAPTQDILNTMALYLKLNKEEHYILIDLAAETHNDIPADIKKLLLNNKQFYKVIRSQFGR